MSSEAVGDVILGIIGPALPMLALLGLAMLLAAWQMGVFERSPRDRWEAIAPNDTTDALIQSLRDRAAAAGYADASYEDQDRMAVQILRRELAARVASLESIPGNEPCSDYGQRVRDIRGLHVALDTVLTAYAIGIEREHRRANDAGQLARLDRLHDAASRARGAHRALTDHVTVVLRGDSDHRSPVQHGHYTPYADAPHLDTARDAGAGLDANELARI